jgi:peptidoglycan/LPS O-acetylase OafA/YrhL
MKSREYVALNALRGIAALAILTRHAPGLFWQVSHTFKVPCGTSLCEGVPGPLFSSYLAVDFFFVLSGFVLAHAYEVRLRTSMTPWRFIVIRTIRLYPLYLLAFAIPAFQLFRQIHHGEADTLNGYFQIGFEALMLPTPLIPWEWSAVLFPLNAVVWSLFFELAANILYGLTARRLANSALFAVIAVSGLGLVICGAWYGALEGGYRWNSFIVGIFRVTFSFFAGVMLFRIRTRVNLPRMRLWPLCLVLIATMAPWLGPYQALYDETAILILFPMLVLAGSFAVESPRWRPLSTALGLASYGIYVLQIPLYGLTSRAYHHFTGEYLHVGAAFGVVFLIGVSAVALVLTKYFDEPVRKWLNSFTKPPARVADAGSAVASQA